MICLVLWSLIFYFECLIRGSSCPCLFEQVDNRDTTEPKVSPDQAVKLCDRNFGIGADGVIFAMPGVNGTDYTMRIFNSDGSEPEVILLISEI